jgi:GT2 family glycosyltransferase
MATKELAASVIILTSDSTSDHTRMTLECLRKHTKLPYELFLYQDHRDNFGFSKDNNKFMKLSCGKYIVLMNDDVYVTPNWLEQMIATAESDEKIGVVGAQLKVPNGPVHFGLRVEFSRDYPEILNNTEYVKETDIVLFALILLKKEVLEKIGYMDESFKLGFEDFEYCLRMRKAGYRIAVSNAQVYHVENVSSSKPLAQQQIVKSAVIFYRRLNWPIWRIISRGTLYLTWNRLRLFAKNHPNAKDNRIVSSFMFHLWSNVYRKKG